MSGHSKWSTIKRQKGAADIKRGREFTKVANAITLSAKSDTKLKAALEQAKIINMPKDNINRAIDRGLGKLPGQILEEVFYEGFGPGKTAFYIEGVTDNKLRTNQEIRSLFERNGGILGGQGSTLYMFDKKGELRIRSKGSGSEEEILELIDIGAQDIEDYLDDNIQKYLVYVESSELNTMGNKITQAGFEVEFQETIYKSNTVVDINDAEIAKKVIEFAQKLEDHDDIQKVYANFDVPEDLLK